MKPLPTCDSMPQVMKYHNCKSRQYISAKLDETVEHSLAAGLIKLDLKLVAVDLDDFAIAELLVEYAHADGEVRTRLGAHRGGGTAFGRGGGAGDGIGRAHG